MRGMNATMFGRDARVGALEDQLKRLHAQIVAEQVWNQCLSLE